MPCPICRSPDHSLSVSKNGYDIHSCPECTVMFVHPFPTPQELTDFYNDYHKSKQYKDKIKSKIKRAKKRIASLRRPGKLEFLDVGCNLGFATEAGRTLGYKATGIDVDTDAIARAKNLFPEADFRCIGSDTLAREGRVFDIVYCSEVIEHLSNPLQFLCDIRSVMSENSVLLLTTPDNGHHSLPKDINKLAEWTSFRPPEHLIYFNKKSLKHIFEAAGFSRIKHCFSFKPSSKVIASI
jgi:SAM-dependent methyltransferase